MNILVISPFPPDSPRGNSVAALRLRNGFAAAGENAAIASPGEVLSSGGRLNSLCGFNPDIVLALHAYHCAEAVKYLKASGGPPVVVSLRGTDANEMFDDKSKSARLLESIAAAEMVTIFSPDIREEIMRRTALPEQKLSVVPNGIDIPSSAADFRRELGIGRDAFIFVSLAGLREVKRPLLPALYLSKIISRHPEVMFLHAGPVLEQKAAEEFIDYSKGKEWIRHVGSVPHHETDSFLRAGDVFVSASSSEGMPHAVREAMFQGLPCLLSDIPGHRRIAEEGKESIFFGGEKDFIVKAVSLIEDPGLRRRIGTNASAKIKEQIGQGGEISGFLICFRKVLEQLGKVH